MIIIIRKNSTSHPEIQDFGHLRRDMEQSESEYAGISGFLKPQEEWRLQGQKYCFTRPLLEVNRFWSVTVCHTGDVA